MNELRELSDAGPGDAIAARGAPGTGLADFAQTVARGRRGSPDGVGRAA